MVVMMNYDADWDFGIVTAAAITKRNEEMF